MEGLGIADMNMLDAFEAARGGCAGSLMNFRGRTLQCPATFKPAQHTAPGSTLVKSKYGDLVTWKAVAGQKVARMQVSGPGTTLANCHLDVPDGVHLVLEGVCAGFTLLNVTITGKDALLHCSGSDCSVTLDNVTLQGCSLLVDGGAEVNLIGCTLNESNVGVYAAGAGTRVSATGKCRFVSCGEGVVCEGAAVSLDKCSVNGSAASGVRCAGGELRATTCAVIDAGAHGIMVLDGGAAVLARCVARGCKEDGVVVIGEGSSVDAEGCSAKECGARGFAVKSGASAELRRCVMRECAGMGLIVRDPSTWAKALDGCEMVECGGHGVCVQMGGVAVLRSCVMRACKEDGVLVVGQGSKADVEGCEAVECGLRGMEVNCGATAVLQRCVMRGCAEMGLLASGKGSRVEARSDCEIVDNREAGVQAQRAAMVVLQGCTVEGNKKPVAEVSGGTVLKLHEDR